jgi:penicillin G amidase
LRAVLRPTLLAAVLALSIAPAAAARTIQAEAILPPGQSGYVSTTGVASGTGSPHLTDQTPLFVDFKRKPFTFGQPGETETPRPDVRIVRDAFGVPAITGQSDQAAWWGAGYAVAQDRLGEMELFRRRGAGTLAEVLGKGSYTTTSSPAATTTPTAS